LKNYTLIPNLKSVCLCGSPFQRYLTLANSCAHSKSSKLVGAEPNISGTACRIEKRISDSESARKTALGQVVSVELANTFFLPFLSLFLSLCLGLELGIGLG